MKIEDIKKAIIKNGGITLNKNLQAIEKRKGYVISTLGYDKTFNNIDNLLINIKVYKQLIKNNNNLYIGVWHNTENGVYYLDISTIEGDKKKALQLGKNNKQIAIYDLKNNKDIKINYNKIKFYYITKLVYNALGEVIDEVNLSNFDTLEEVSSYLNYSNNHIRHIVNNNIIINKMYKIYSDYVDIEELTIY